MLVVKEQKLDWFFLLFLRRVGLLPCNYNVTSRGVQIAGENERSFLPFLENWNKVPWFWKNMPWLCSSMGYISHLKCLREKVKYIREKLRNCLLQGFSSVCGRKNVYVSVLIPRNLPCSEKFLVTSLLANVKSTPIFWNLRVLKSLVAKKIFIYINGLLQHIGLIDMFLQNQFQ